MDDPQIVFISCGQVTSEEKELGAAICELVKSKTPFQPYYAEYQTSLEGLTRNILTNLGRCIGLIAVLHPRGIVKFPDGSTRIRASVWVEQEIAIAAFLKQVTGKELYIAAYAHESVAREGIRDQLLLNPRIFSDSIQVLEHLGQILPTWNTLGAAPTSMVEIQLTYEKMTWNSERHDYRLKIYLYNKGNDAIERFHADIEFPRDYLEPGIIQALEVKSRNTPTHRFFRSSQETHQCVLYHGDPVLIFSIDYFVDAKLYRQKRGLFDEIVKVKVFIPGREPESKEMKMQDLQMF